MPPHSDAVVSRALLDSWQSGLISLVCLVLLALICWAIPFAINRIYGKDGYRDRETKAREREADRQVSFIDTLQSLQEQRDILCGRHASGLDVLGDNVQTLCSTLCEHGRRTEAFMQAMLDSEGLGGFQQRVEVSVVELADHLKNNTGLKYIPSGKKAKIIDYDTRAASFDFKHSQTIFTESDHVLDQEPLPLETSRGCLFKCSFCDSVFT